jgi:hypothetical protein
MAEDVPKLQAALRNLDQELEVRELLFSDMRSYSWCPSALFNLMSCGSSHTGDAGRRYH